MNVKIHFILISLISMLCTVQGLSQSAVLERYVEMALNNNLQIKTQHLAYNKQSSKIEQAKKLWAPQVDLNTSYLLARGGRVIDFPVGDLFNPTYSALNQLLSANQFPTDLENINTQLTPNNFLDAQLNLTKPLINSNIKYNRLIQEEVIKLNELDIDLQKIDIILQVKTAYYNYAKSFEGLNILEASESLLKDILAFNKKLIKYDKATNDALYDVEFQLSQIESQKILITEQQETVKALFNLLLDRHLNEDIELDPKLLTFQPELIATIENLQQEALESRMELNQIEVAESINALNQKRVEKERLPELGISAGVGYQTESFNFSEDPLFTLGLGLSMNLFDGGLRKKKIEELQIDREVLDLNRSQLNQQIEIEVLQEYYAIQSLLGQMQTDQSAVRFAEKSYDSIYKRYQNDKAILIEVIQAQNRLTTSQLNQTLTKYDYLIQKAKLDKALSKK